VALALGWLGMATLGFNVVRVGGFAVSDGLFFMCGAVIVFKLLASNSRGLAPARARGSSQLVLAGSIILLTAGVLATFLSWGPTTSLLVVVRLGYITLLWFWILQTITSSRRALNVLLSGWRWGVLFTAACATVSQLHLARIGSESPEGREMAFFGHPNDLGGYLLSGLPLMLLALPRREGRSQSRTTVLRLGSVALVVFGITAAGSITALASAAVGAAATFGIPVLLPEARQTRRRRHPLTVLGGVVLALVGILMLARSDLPVVERIQRFTSGDQYLEQSVQSRGESNSVALHSFDQRLVVGVGFDSGSVAAAGDDRILTSGVHNMYLKVMYEAGLPGLIGLLLILGATFRAAVLLLRNTRSTELYPIVVALSASGLSVGIFAMFQPTLFHRFFWLPIAMMWCVWHLRREELRQQSREREDAERELRAQPEPVPAPAADPAPPAALPPGPPPGRPNGRG
jgi:O-antigen ligase